jgi:hypothetical protein
MIWEKVWSKFVIGLVVALMVSIAVVSVVSADTGINLLNPNAQEAAKVVGYGNTGNVYYISHSDRYMNPVARDSGVIVWKTSDKIPVYLNDWYNNNPAYVTEWYKTPEKPPDMTPWKDYCVKYGVKY